MKKHGAGKTKQEPGELAINRIIRERNKLEQNVEALSKSRDYLMDSIAETNKTHVAERQERQKALDVERGAMQEHLARLRIINQKILMEARKAVASVVLVSPSERTKADETELKCFIQVIEAWAQEQEFKLASLTHNAHYDPRKLAEIRRITESEPGDQFWGTSIVELMTPDISRAFRQEYPTDLDGASIMKERKGASLHPGRVTSDVIAKVVKKHIAMLKGGEKK